MAQFNAQNEAFNDLFESILSLQNIDECRAFFCDLCTVPELQGMAQRLKVARRLIAGDSYKDIQKHIAVSSATITRINTALQYGTGGYHLVCSRPAESPRE